MGLRVYIHVLDKDVVDGHQWNPYVDFGSVFTVQDMYIVGNHDYDECEPERELEDYEEIGAVIASELTVFP